LPKKENNSESDVPLTFYDKVTDNIILNIMKQVELVLEKEIESKT
jgi:hypothetical protein